MRIGIGLVVAAVGELVVWLERRGFDGGKAVALGAAGSLVLGNKVIAVRTANGPEALQLEVKDLVGAAGVEAGLAVQRFVWGWTGGEGGGDAGIGARSGGGVED